jgi:hypothetical protein
VAILLAPLSRNVHDERFLVAAPFMLLGMVLACLSPFVLGAAVVLAKRRGIRLGNVTLPDGLVFAVLTLEVLFLCMILCVSAIRA